MCSSVKQAGSLLDGIFTQGDSMIRHCDVHGEYTARVYKVGSIERELPCIECFEAEKEERSRIEMKEMEEKHKRLREEAEQRRIKEKTGAARIPKRFQGKTFADYIAETPQQRKALEACESYAHNFSDNLEAGRCLILSGNVGTGKTHLAAAIADYVVRETEYTAIFRSLHSILQAIKSTYAPGSEVTEAEIFRLLTGPDLLIVDEVGATKPSEFELSTLFALINTRYENKLPTIVVTNLAASELKNSIGDRCADRLREGGGRAIAFDWKSKRSTL